MTKSEAINVVKKAFRDIKRPTVFIRGTCHCDECIEHNQTLSNFNPDTITIDQLGNPCWDPICFAGDQAFTYYLPAMIRLAFEDDYIDQLIFHLESEGRLDNLTPSQIRAIQDALETLLKIDAERILDTVDESDIVKLIHKLDQKTK